MRLTNKQLEIVVDEIYNEVSIPIQKENKEAIDNVKINKDKTIKDFEKINELQEEKDAISRKIEKIEESYRRKAINGMWFGYSPSDHLDEYIYHLKKKKAKIKIAPTKDQIEREVILAGNKDIPALIEALTKKLTNNE